MRLSTGISDVELQRERSERFEVAFNQIHAQLKRLVKGTRSDAFAELLHHAGLRHSLVKKFQDDLRQFARLRNALVHEKTKQNYYIAEPHAEIVSKIEEIAQFLHSPPKVTTIASKSVVTFEVEDRLEEVLREIVRYPFSQFPVYEGERFAFLLTKGGITSWMASQINQSVISLEDVILEELKSYHSKHNVAFIHEEADIFRLEDVFEEQVQKGRKLEAVIVTEQGTKREKPRAIITPWDLIKIDLL